MDPIVFADSANPGLAGEVAKLLGLPIGRCTLKRCPDTELNRSERHTDSRRI